MTRGGETLGTVTTPAPLTIKRHASTIQVVCRKAGYEDGRIVMNSRFETASAGNFLVGGIIGVMVDASSGANSRYDSNVMVRLTPMSPADAAAVAAAAKAARLHLLRRFRRRRQSRRRPVCSQVGGRQPPCS